MLCYKSRSTRPSNSSSTSSQATTSTATKSPPQPKAPETKVENHPQVLVETANPRPPVLLTTAIMDSLDRWSRVVTARALLDQGSEISLVSEALANRLGLSRTSSRLAVVGIGQHTMQAMKALVMPKLIGLLPSVAIPKQLRDSWAHIKHLQLADPEFYVPAPIDAIFGADVYSTVLKDGVKKGPEGQPTAQSTELGWVLSGNTLNLGNNTSLCTASKNYHQGVSCQREEELYNLVKRFWLQEEQFDTTESSGFSDDICMSYFISNYERDTHGRFVVRYQFKKPVDTFGNSFELALRMLHNQEKRMVKNPTLQQAYCEFMTEYESQGHMVKASPVEDHSKCYYLPHHSVIKESSTSTKLRVVFNGSQKTNTGESLNDNLYEDPKQISIHPEDRKYQRILWRDTLDSPVQEYELTTVTYGTKPAPFLALATLRQLELEKGDKFPLVKSAISQGSYMDDIYVGADNLQQGIDKAVQIQKMLHSDGFKLRKWISNSKELLCNIPKNFHEKSTNHLSEDHEIFRTLGLNWDTTSDCFSYIPITFKEPKTVTRRVVLAQVAQIFDPLGWISPVVVKGKLYMQSLWKIKLDWDEQIPENLLGPWRDFISQLSHLSEIKIPRWLNITPTVTSMEIHGFGDASIGAVVYLVTIDSLGVAKSTIIASKSKLAPIKSDSNSSNKKKCKVSTPRLELSAAVLLVKLVRDIQQSLDCQSANIHLWTDSSITYYWITGDVNRWKTFVHNRVVFIQNTLTQATWHHVPGEDNPADVVSRGTSSSQLYTDLLWWQGPAWIIKNQNKYPVLNIQEIDMTQVEEKPLVCNVMSTISESYLDNFSSLRKAVTAAAWLRRFCQSFSARYFVDRSSWITSEKRKITLLGLVINDQRLYFHEVIKQLSKGEALSRSSPLIKLTPFLYKDGALRVGGRLSRSLMTSDHKNPLILPRESKLTELILNECHVNTLHGGAQLMLATLRQQYWIVGG
ncbi:uncharacterized protein LOC122850549 [Aphidius gifuensis]|uniref:uncharacterized protein LOC122850549 n=1 Tax=Aphidius gifuensis TaxID=684658 RepID=UPI001CDD8E56|nr:uncharacterized protein LOC122850549 [Aphidius gifuensis]